MSLNLPERIETARLVLTRLQPEDAEEIFYTYASKPQATRYMAWPTHQSIRDTRQFLTYADRGWRNGTDYSFSIRLATNRRLVGSCGMIHQEGKIQFGYVIGPVHWRMGYATEATLAMLDQVKNSEEVYRIHTFIDTENTASINVVKKCGLVVEARLEKWFRFPNQNNVPKDCFVFILR